MTEEEKVEFVWYEVTWHVVCGRTYVKAGGEAEAKMLASQHGLSAPDEDKGWTGPGGERVINEYYETDEEEPYISDVEEDVDGAGAGLEADGK